MFSKISKTAHLTIIGTFVVVFLVVYLYFTISDLRRLQSEVSKLSKQVAALEAKGSNAAKVQPIETAAPSTQQQVKPAVQVAQPVVPQVQVVTEESGQEDNDSVVTEDIKKLLADAEDDDDKPLDPPTKEPELPVTQDDTLSPVESSTPETCALEDAVASKPKVVRKKVASK